MRAVAIRQGIVSGSADRGPEQGNHAQRDARVLQVHRKKALGRLRKRMRAERFARRRGNDDTMTVHRLRNDHATTAQLQREAYLNATTAPPIV
jgi:hypothetical protein